MASQNLNVDWKIGGKKCRVRKRRCSSSSSSSSSLVKNYRVKRAVLVWKRNGSSISLTPMWKKMMSSNSKSPPLLGKEKTFKNLSAKVCSDQRDKELSVSARKLAATLWEINGMSSPRLKREDLEDKVSEVGINIRKKERISEFDPFHGLVSERMDPSKVGSHKRRVSAGSQKLMQGECGLRAANSPYNYLVEVDQTQIHAPSPCKHIDGSKNRLKDVHHCLTTSKELLKVLSRIWHLENQNSTSLSLVSALQFELDRACTLINKSIKEQIRPNQNELDVLVKQFEEEKTIMKIKQQNRIHSAITSMAGEVEKEKKLRQQTERLNKKLGRELAETKASLSMASKELDNEKRAREILEQVCEALANGIGEDRAVVEELKRQSEKDRQEVEKEREMLQLADVLREERVQMKLREAKYQFEEKNAILDKLRDELEIYLKSKTREEREEGSPRFDKIKELEEYLKETLPKPYQFQSNDQENIKEVNEVEEGGDDSADSDLHSIELNVDDSSKSFQWSNAVKNVDKSKGRDSISDKTKNSTISSETKHADSIEWEFINQENLEMFDKRELVEFAPQSWKKGVEDELERYNTIKDLRDRIVSGSRIVASQDLASPNQNFAQQSIVSSKDPSSVVCHG